jgi:glycerol kinase
MLTRFAGRGHLARAALRLDGGMVANELVMQFQADIAGVPVLRPAVTETTALGTAYAAGLAVGVWQGPEALAAHWQPERRWEPVMPAPERARLRGGWNKAVALSLDRVD